MTDTTAIHWPILKKFFFLFLLLYSFFYIFPFPFDIFPLLDIIFSNYDKLHTAFVHWAGVHILNISDPERLFFSDSSDTSFDYAAIFIFSIISGGLAIIILFADRKRTNYETQYQWLFICIRYCIAFYMLSYGFDKVFKSHFPFPSLVKLEQTFGESTPQGLLWAFMGYSTPYTIYIGSIEVLSGFLLLFRRTTAIGALSVMIIMINVAIINFCYDVPVKLFALHLVGFSLFLSQPFLRSIFSFFILKQQASLPEAPVYPGPLLRYKKVVKPLLILSFTLMFVSISITRMRTYGDSAPKPALYGIYKTAEDFKNAESNKGKLLSAGLEKIIFDQKLTLVKMRDRYLYFSAQADTVNKVIYFISNSDTTQKFHLNYLLKNNLLTLTENDSLRMVFEKKDLNTMPLISRGFHWVVEYPINY